jgi:MFS family permease
MPDTDRRRGRAARPGLPRAKVLNVVRVSSGNFLEMFDFMVLGYYASSIGSTFFPNENAFASLMLALTTFGVGFLMRPIGAVILGAYIDRFGRRAGLILTLSLMAIGTLLIACLPGYAVIGVAAPIVILISRLVQGFSAGVELGGVSVYLSEIATPGRKGFYVSWQSASQQVAVMFAALIGVILHALLPPATMEQWGWRVPFWIGCLIIPLYLFDPYHQQQGDAGCLDVHGRFGGIGRRTLGGRTAYDAKCSWARAAGVNIEIKSVAQLRGARPTKRCAIGVRNPFPGKWKANHLSNGWPF